MEDGELEILDVENYKSNEQQQFSHQVLVMKVMNKCIEAGCREMKAGYWIKKMDKFGNSAMVYIPDTRKEFIEYVKSAEMVMVCDLDDDAEKNIPAIKKNMKEYFEVLSKVEQNDWANSPSLVKKSRWSKGIYQREGGLNIDLPYYQDYINFETDCYREIFAELTQLTKRLDFYSEEEFEG